MANVQSISPCDTPFTTPKIGRTERQGTPPVEWKLSDRIAWAMGLDVAPLTKLVAVAIAQRARSSSGLAWPGMGCLVKDTRMSRSSVIRAVKELEQGGHLTVTRLKVDAKRHASNRYRLPAMTGSLETPPSVCETPPPSVCETPELVRTLEPVKKAAPPPVLSESQETETNKPDRHVCPCGNSWPKTHGPVCFQCHKSVLPGSRLQHEYGDRYGANHHAGLAAPEPGKYDFLFDGDEPKPDPPARPDPPPLTPEKVADLEAQAVADGFRKTAAGKWTRYEITHAEKRRQYQRADGSWSELPAPN